jgi:hypothetical protein
MTSLDATPSKLRILKPVAIALAYGLLLGPIISSLAGVQITTIAARAQLKAAVLEQQASFCEAQARGEVTHTGALDWNARYDLAKKWAVLPGAGSADAAVASACAAELAR